MNVNFALFVSPNDVVSLTSWSCLQVGVERPSAPTDVGGDAAEYPRWRAARDKQQ